MTIKIIKNIIFCYYYCLTIILISNWAEHMSEAFIHCHPLESKSLNVLFLLINQGKYWKITSNVV